MYISADSIAPKVDDPLLEDQLTREKRARLHTYIFTLHVHISPPFDRQRPLLLWIVTLGPGTMPTGMANYPSTTNKTRKARRQFLD